MKGDGVSGAAVSNPPAVGGAGLALALDVLQKKDHPHMVKITPTVWDSEKDLGQAEGGLQRKARSVLLRRHQRGALHQLFDGADHRLQRPLI